MWVGSDNEEGKQFPSRVPTVPSTGRGATWREKKKGGSGEFGRMG